MRNFKFFFFASLLFTTGVFSNTLRAQEGLPPIIDREILFGNPEIAGAQLSPDGKWMSFIKPYNEVRNIWVKAADAPFEDATPVTADKERPIPGYFWSQDSKYLLYVQDKGGDENYHVYALDPFGEAGENGVPEARNITNVDGTRALIYRVPKSNPDIMYVGINDRDAAWHDLYEVTISTGERELIRQNDNQITNWTFDQDDKLRMAARTTEDGGTELLVLDGDEMKPCYTCSVLETCSPIGFHKSGDFAYLITNKGDEVDLTQLMKFDPKTFEATLIEKDPENQVDFGGVIFSDVSKELIATTYVGDKPRTYFKNKKWEAEYEWLKSQFPGSEVDMGSSTADENKWLVYVNSDTDPGATYLYDRKKQKVTFQYRPRPELPVESLAKMEAIRYKSSDGLEIPAYLTLPKGLEAKDLPLVVMPHGGPWARDYWGYNPYSQFLANRGYAVLNPNFRASTGYGKAFLNAGNKEWGQLMQDDITWGVKHLVEKGIVDEKRVAIMGGSYGGYATLAGLTFTPDVYAAGVSIVGPSNLITLLESIPPYWESIRKTFYERMGNPETEEGKAQLIRQSPLFSADKITVPLMVVQGANDPRVKKAESDQIVVAMRELGLPVEYICAPDEGHGFRRPENNMAFLAAGEKFLAKHIGGRYQEDMPENIAKRLEEITVDINTVEMPKAVSEDKLSAALPKPSSDLAAGSSDYGMTIAMGGREIPMDVMQSISEEGDNWVIVQSAKSMMGEMKDICTLKKGSLMPVSRTIQQGPATVEITHSADKISGVMKVQGNEQPIEASLENAVFADGAGLYETLARLPLAKGYTAVYRTFDPMTQKVKAYELKVVGLEEVEVPAGKFEALKAEVTSLEDGTNDTKLWFGQGEQIGLIKSTSKLPAMGGATVIMELK